MLLPEELVLNVLIIRGRLRRSPGHHRQSASDRVQLQHRARRLSQLNQSDVVIDNRSLLGLLPQGQILLSLQLDQQKLRR